MNPNIKTIVIAYDTSNGTFKISGPMQDGTLYLGMLEMAKVSFLENREEIRKDSTGTGEGDGKKKIVIPSLVIPKV